MSKKRGNGEGSITKRKDGRWMARYTVHTANGPKRRHIYGRTRQEVAERLSKAVSDRVGGVIFDGDYETLGAYLQRWLDEGVRGTVKQSTLENYAYIVRLHIIPELGCVRLRALKSRDVRRHYREKLDAGLSPRTVQIIHTVLRKALQQAVRDDVLPRNVCDAVTAPRQTKKEMQPLTPAQAKLDFSHLSQSGWVAHRPSAQREAISRWLHTPLFAISATKPQAELRKGLLRGF